MHLRYKTHLQIIHTYLSKRAPDTRKHVTKRHVHSEPVASSTEAAKEAIPLAWKEQTVREDAFSPQALSRLAAS